MLAVFWREFAACFRSAFGYAVLVCFVIAMGVVSVFVMPRLMGMPGDWFTSRELTMHSFFAAFPWVAAVVMPAIAMRTWAEDARSGTLQLLMTLPIPTWKLVAGKFCGAVAFFEVLLLATLPWALMVLSEAPNQLGAIFAGYCGAWMLGAAFIAIGMYISALTSSQMAAYIGSFLVCGVLVAWSTFAGLLAPAGGLATELLAWFSLTGHVSALAQGHLRLDSLLLTGSLAVVALLLNTVALEWRRYR